MWGDECIQVQNGSEPNVTLLFIWEEPFIFSYALQPFKAYCAIWVRRSTIRHQASPRESTQRRKVELWARNVL